MAGVPLAARPDVLGPVPASGGPVPAATAAGRTPRLPPAGEVHVLKSRMRESCASGSVGALREQSPKATRLIPPQSEAIIEHEDALYLMLESDDQKHVNDFIKPFVMVGSLDVYPASTCVRVVASGGEKSEEDFCGHWFSPEWSLISLGCGLLDSRKFDVVTNGGKQN